MYTRGSPDRSTPTPGLLRLVLEDYIAHGRSFAAPGFQALAIHRLGNARSWISPRLLRAPATLLYRLLARSAASLYGIELPESAHIRRRVIFEHQHGIILHGGSVVGDDCIIRQGVVLGMRSMSRVHEAPKLGCGVSVGAGAKIIGKVSIGDGASIGANAVVLADVPAGRHAVGVPARLVERRREEVLEGRTLRRRLSDARLAAPGAPVSTVIHVLTVIVNYRSAALALRCLASLAAEAKRPELRLSVMVVENASGDEAVLAEGIAREYSDFARLVVSPVNGGFGAGCNLGVRAADEAGLRPDYVHFLNPDTEVRRRGVLTLAQFLESHPRAGLASGSFEHEDGTPGSLRSDSRARRASSSRLAGSVQ